MSFPKYDCIVIDCHNLAYRMWWHRRDLKTSQGVHSGMEYGFLSGLIHLVRKYPEAVPVLVWDGVPERCLQIYPVTVTADGTRVGYKANRNPLAARQDEPDWGPRFERLRDVLQRAVLTVYSPTHEADEEIARVVLSDHPIRSRFLICSRDQDMKQLVRPYIHLSMADKDPVTGDDVIVTDTLLESVYGIPPWKIPLWRAIEGDGSDDIPGIPRIPKALIRALVQGCDDLEGLIHCLRVGSWLKTVSQREKLQSPEAEATIRRNYALMELQSQAKCEPTWGSNLTGDLTPVFEFCDRLEFQSLLHREEWGLLSPSGRPPSPL